jgi:hypothetical protein
MHSPTFIVSLCVPRSLRNWCASTPVRYYTLSATTEPAASSPSSDLSVVVGPGLGAGRG